MGGNRPSLGGEVVEQVELGLGERDAGAVGQQRLPGGRVDGHRADGERLRRGFPGRGGAAQLDADAGQQFRRAERLGQVIVGAVVQAGDLVVHAALFGEHDHRGPDTRVAQLVEDGEAVLVGQDHVEQDEIRLLRPDTGQGIAAVRCHPHGHALGGEEHHEHVADEGIVLEEEECAWVRCQHGQPGQTWKIFLRNEYDICLRLARDSLVPEQDSRAVRRRKRLRPVRAGA